MENIKSHLAHRFRKLNWLDSGEIYDDNWLFETLETYSPLDEHKDLGTLAMVPEDLPELNRLFKQDRWGAFIDRWLRQMVELENPLREYIALFWHSHIPTGTGHKFEHAQLLLEIFRQYGLGEVGTLMKKIAANPAMMYWLDGHWSHKSNPNENFSRELMELFMLGEGNYNLQDVKEASRAFTGRRFNHKSYPYEMFIDHDAFDASEKNIFGETGNFNGEDVIDLILKQQSCAKYLASKILSFLISPNLPDDVVDDCSNYLFSNHYNIKSFLIYALKHPKLNDIEVWHSKIKTPIELIVFFQRQTGARFMGLKTTQGVSRQLGQHLFNPPSVAGWPNDKRWLQGSYLAHRLLTLPHLISIKNRSIDKASLTYKIHSHVNKPTLREFRYKYDLIWNEDLFHSTLLTTKINTESWLISKPGNSSLTRILSNIQYQFNC